MTTNSYRTAVAAAQRAGLVDAGFDGKGHHRFCDPNNPESFVSISTSMAVTGRSLPNTLAQIARVAGQSSRGREAFEGERRERKRRKSIRASGFDPSFAAREQRRNADKYELTTPADRERCWRTEREELMAELLTATERDERAEELAARVVELDGLIAEWRAS